MPDVVVALITAGLVTLAGCGQTAATPQAPAPPTPPTTTPATGQPVTVLGEIRAGALPRMRHAPRRGRHALPAAGHD